MVPRLSIVGAGPGAPDLITLKAIRALEDADVVLYDALISKELLKYASKAEKIFVGKRKGCYAYHQDQINELIVERAKSKGHVVRLKGGDPFVFGRGTEEIEFAERFGVSTSVIPGVSSAIAVPANQGIPLTKRGASESFWVITGTTKSHQLSKDVYLAAKSNATVVILMGMNKLSEIVRIFAAENKNDTPVAIIQEGTTVRERFGVGTIDTIEDIVTVNKLSSPAVIVIGEVVRKKHEMQEVTSRLYNEHSHHF